MPQVHLCHAKGRWRDLRQGPVGVVTGQCTHGVLNCNRFDGKEPTMDDTLPPPTCAACTAQPGDPQRRFWLMTTAAAGGVAALATAIPFVSTFAPSERAKAAGGPVEVDIADIPPGGVKTVEWRGKPVWVVRRTPEMIAALQGHDGELTDPASAVAQQPAYASNAARAIKAEVFVAVGICTHLGCSPKK